jgi:hypothetical protein
MLPDPVSHAAQVLEIAIPRFARNAYSIALAVDECEDEAMVKTLPRSTNSGALR